MPVLVDTNVLLDIATEDPQWMDWSSAHLRAAVDGEGVALNPIIYAELSVHYPTLEGLEDALSGFRLARLPLPWDAAFLAGKAFLRYRRKGGVTRSPSWTSSSAPTPPRRACVCSPAMPGAIETISRR